MIYLCIAVFQPVGNYKPFSFVHRIVAGCLVKYRLIDFDGRGFALYNHDALTLGIEDDNVGAFL